MKKYILPLYNFPGFEMDCFNFSTCPFSIRRSNFDMNLSESLSLSTVDRVHIRDAEWALIIDSETYSIDNNDPLNGQVQNDVNLLILAFRLLRLGPCPLIKHLIPQDQGEESIVFYDTIQGNSQGLQIDGTYDSSKLLKIDAAYGILKNADSEVKYSRAHNAIYFAYLATHTTHWIQSFVFWMSALEALFSKDSPGGATRTIKRRVSAYIGDPNIATEKDVENIYEIRSRIVHGDICASKNTPEENLKILWMVEKIACACFSKLIGNNDFIHYSKAHDRNSFVRKLD
jgi:Apea-like HEPN